MRGKLTDFQKENMKNKPRTLQEYIEYRNKLITRLEARKRQGLRPISGKEDYYTIRLREIDEQISEFKGIGKVYLKGGNK